LKLKTDQYAAYTADLVLTVFVAVNSKSWLKYRY